MKEKRRYLRNNMTRAEVILWQALRRKNIFGYRFLRQYSVDHYILDFYCSKLKLAIEVDGDSHLKDGAKEYDETRQKHIETIGIQFLRFTNHEVFQNPDGVCQSIINKISAILSVHKAHPDEENFGRSGRGESNESVTSCHRLKLEAAVGE